MRLTKSVTKNMAKLMKAEEVFAGCERTAATIKRGKYGKKERYY